MYKAEPNLRQVTIFLTQIHSTQSKTPVNFVCLQVTPSSDWEFIDAVFLEIYRGKARFYSVKAPCSESDRVPRVLAILPLFLDSSIQCAHD